MITLKHMMQAIVILVLSSIHNVCFAHSENQNLQQKPLYQQEGDQLFKKAQWQMGFSLEEQNAHFDWNIASDITGTHSPNILSELTYENLEISSWSYNIEGKIPLKNNINTLFQFHLSQGVIDEGIVQDSDYSNNFRTNEFSRSYSSPDGSNITSYKLTLGLENNTFNQSNFTYLFGIAHNSQNFIKTNGEQVVSSSTTPGLGKFNGLKSSYAADWLSWFTGIQFTKAFNTSQFRLRSEYHFADYNAEADWNLRTDFQHPKSFEHLANGTGLIASINYALKIAPNLSMQIAYTSERWKTKTGIDRVFFSNGTQASTRLNAAHWESNSMSIGLYYQN